MGPLHRAEGSQISPGRPNTNPAERVHIDRYFGASAVSECFGMLAGFGASPSPAARRAPGVAGHWGEGTGQGGIAMMVRLMPDWNGSGRPLAYRPLGGRMTVLREEYADVLDAADLVRRAGEGGRWARERPPGSGSGHDSCPQRRSRRSPGDPNPPSHRWQSSPYSSQRSATPERCHWREDGLPPIRRRKLAGEGLSTPMVRVGLSTPMVRVGHDRANSSGTSPTYA